MKILLADDEKELTNALSAILKHNNYSVDVVYDGADAYSYASCGEYDCIVLDIMMPKMDGIEVVGKLRETGVQTPDHRLIRRSLEKPVYKEKFRVRSYGVPDSKSTVFIELKKKYKGVVYKRRAGMTLEQSEEFINSGTFTEKHYQIESEIAYFINFYKDIAPAMFVSYERIAFVGVDNQNLRITFDKNITYREHELSLDKGVWGTKLLNEGERVLEIKIPGAMPLWLAEILDDLKIYPTSFSKYGRAYLQTVNKKLKMEKVNNCA